MPQVVCLNTSAFTVFDSKDKNYKFLTVDISGIKPFVKTLLNIVKLVSGWCMSYILIKNVMPLMFECWYVFHFLLFILRNTSFI